MNLLQSEIEERIEIAISLYELHKNTFSYYKIMDALDDVDEEFLFEYMYSGYQEIFADIDENVEAYINKMIREELDTTLRTKDTSNKRAIIIAETDTNAIANYKRNKEMILQGYTRKRWDTMKDNLVRHSHVMADGQEVAITEAFTVGGSKMYYPMDSSLGAGADEIVNCRCVCKYFR